MTQWSGKTERVPARQRENYLQEPTLEAHNAYDFGDGEIWAKENTATARGQAGENGILKPKKKNFQVKGSNQYEIIGDPDKKSFGRDLGQKTYLGRFQRKLHKINPNQ